MDMSVFPIKVLIVFFLSLQRTDITKQLKKEDSTLVFTPYLEWKEIKRLHVLEC